MDEKTLKELSRMAGEARELDVVTFHEDPYVYYLHNKAAGTYDRVEVPPSIHRTAMTVGSFVGQLASTDRVMGEPADHSVLVSERQVIACLDISRRSTLTMKVIASTAAKWLAEQSNPLTMKSLEQRAFLRVLRTILPKHQALYDAVSHIKVVKNESGEATVKHGKESLGISLQRELAGWSGPEAVTFDVQMVDRPIGLPVVPVECLVDIDLGGDGDPPTFGLIPMAGSMEAALEQVLEFVAESLVVEAQALGLDVPVWLGSFSVT